MTRRLKFYAILTLSGLISGLMFSNVCQAQSHVFSVYVDPIFGDDDFASGANNKTMLNPTNTAPTLGPDTSALSPYPNTSVSNAPTGVLVAASVPFRTLTAAVNYVYNNFVNQTTNEVSYSNNGHSISHINILLMPGRYVHTDTSPGSLYTPYIDTETGQPCGGEKFPIYLPDGVSLIGTSALNTVLDGAGATSIVQMMSMNGDPMIPGFQNTVIKNLSFVGAGGEALVTPANKHSAAIVITGENACHPTIRECLFYSNPIGIAIDNVTAYWNSEQFVFTERHSPIICNNTCDGTFVVNTTLGWYWSQQWYEYYAGGRPRIWNNVVLGPWPFLGVHPCDLSISLSPTVMQDFNAYDPTCLNQQPPPVPYPVGNWYMGTGVDPALPPAIYSPIVDLSSYHNNPQPFNRNYNGCLFINDNFARSSALMNNRSNPSPHDYRISPRSTPNATGAPTNLNPLVNNGYTLIGSPNPPFNQFPANNQTYDPMWQAVPNQAAPNVINFVYRFDGEGYGNPRVYDHPFYPTDYQIDLGFDELGDLVMAGYHNKTTLFHAGTNNIPNGSTGFLPNIVDSGYVYFFSPQPVGTPLTKPTCSWEIGDLAHWFWTQAITTYNLPGQPTGNFTMGKTGTSDPFRYLCTEIFKLNASDPTKRLYPPFPRNQRSDLSPHLLPDIHPLWSESPLWNGANDIFACNTWTHAALKWGPTISDPPNPIADGAQYFGCMRAGIGPIPLALDNPFCYSGQLSGIYEDTPNPPGSTIFSTALGYLLPSFRVIPWQISTLNLVVNAHGFTNAEPVPFTASLPIRFNCQLNTTGNIQSFRIVSQVSGP